jgi:prepilin-type N-terminal cleavage/methylation domain-containing protein
MNTGGDHHKADGFTIVETLIVLAVSSLLLASAILLINGRQAKTEFYTGINQVYQQIQQVVNEAATGYYPNNGDFRCRSDRPLRIDSGSNEQGTNGECIFLGKVISHDASGGNNRFRVYSLAGNRLASDGVVASTLGETWPTAIAPGTTVNNSAPDMTVDYPLPGGLTFVWGSGNGSASHTNYPDAHAFAIVSSLGTFDASTRGVLTSGSQQFGLYGFANSWAGITAEKDVVDRINAATVTPATTRFIAFNSMEICYASGGTDQSGLIKVGSGSGGLAVSLVIKNGRTC